MNLIYTLEREIESKPSIFLSGPTYRSVNMPEDPKPWREEAVKYLEELEFDGNVFIPEYRDNVQPADWTHSRQVDWEVNYLSKVDVILMWIPRDMKYLPGMVTNIEFGEWLKSGRLICGAPETAERNQYLMERCVRVGVKWLTDLKSLCQEAIIMTRNNPYEPDMWFTADTHFGDERTRVFSRRPFDNTNEMDWELVKRWNMKVRDVDTVCHLGDFGDPNMIKYLRFGKMYLIPGNYDKPEVIAKIMEDTRVVVLDPKGMYLSGSDLFLVHEPLKIKDTNFPPTTFYLFGHIHKISMVKRNSLNVGVDCHNFYPINLKEVSFFANAINRYYDDNVFWGGKE